MIITIPISHSDFKDSLRVLSFIKALTHFGPYLEHDLLIVTQPSDLKCAMALKNFIAHLFYSTDIHVFPEDGPKGWPQGPNFYWKNTIEYFKYHLTENTQPWFWMEMDCVPLKKDWPTLLEKEYRTYGKPFLGTVDKTVEITTDMLRVYVGEHLQGTAVYPPKLHEFCTVWEYVDRIPKAFDVLCQWETVPQTHRSKLIQQGFRTINYKISFDPFKIKGEDNGDLDGVATYDTPLTTEAVVHHGCKDTSLSDIVTSEEYALWTSNRA